MVLQRLLSITRATICGADQRAVTGSEVMACEHASTRPRPTAPICTHPRPPVFVSILTCPRAATPARPRQYLWLRRGGASFLGGGCRVPAGINHRRDDDPCLGIAERLLSVGTHAAFAWSRDPPAGTWVVACSGGAAVARQGFSLQM